MSLHSGLLDHHYIQDYELDFYLRTSWRDHRLVHKHGRPYQFHDREMARKLWWPDIIFLNAKRSSFHEVTVPNFWVNLYQNGTIWMSTRFVKLLYLNAFYIVCIKNRNVMLLKENKNVECSLVVEMGALNALA